MRVMTIFIVLLMPLNQSRPNHYIFKKKMRSIAWRKMTLGDAAFCLYVFLGRQNDYIFLYLIIDKKWKEL